MKPKEMDILTGHYDVYFHQSNPIVLHPVVMKPHIDVLLYEPNKDFPFWKLATMGASDHKMKSPRNALGNRNEYIMFIDPHEDLSDKEVLNWYYDKLLLIARYSITANTFISYCHSIEWAPNKEEGMVCAFLELPQITKDAGFLHCKLGFRKTAVCLQAVLLNREETDKLMQVGPQKFSNYLYPEEGTPHFLCERIRSSRF